MDSQGGVETNSDRNEMLIGSKLEPEWGEKATHNKPSINGRVHFSTDGGSGTVDLACFR